MKPNTPDHFNYRPWLAAAVSAAFFVPLLVLGGPALAKSAASASQYQYGGSSQYQYKGKVTICHHTHSKKHPWVQISVGAIGREGASPASRHARPLPDDVDLR